MHLCRDSGVNQHHNYSQFTYYKNNAKLLLSCLSEEYIPVKSKVQHLILHPVCYVLLLQNLH